MTINIEAEVARLEQMPVRELREEYAERCGEMTSSRHRKYLIRKIAWRIQAQTEGGLCKRRPENVALGGEWWSVEKRSAQVITRSCFSRVSGFPENSDRADCGGQECSLTWSC